MYVYKVTCIPTQEFYYGARWSSSVKSFEEDFWKTYFTSSKLIKQRIRKYGIEQFKCECLWEGNDVGVCMDTERKYILGSQHDELCLNLTYHNFHPISLDKGRRNSNIRAKRKALIKGIKKMKNAEFVYIRAVDRAYEHLNYIEQELNKTYDRIREFLKSVPVIDTKPPYIMMYRDSDKSSHRVNIQYTNVLERIGYVQGRIDWIVEKVRIGNLKDGQKLFHKGKHEKWFKESEIHDALDDGWVPGRSPRARDAISKAGGRPHTEEAKKKLSEIGKRKVYYTSPCLTKLRAFFPGDEIPEGWIKGNKLKSRNQKITESLYVWHRNKKSSI